MCLFKNRKTKVAKPLDETYEGRFFYKKVYSIEGNRVTIRVDKVELTEYYQSIIHDVELKVAREFLNREPTEDDMSGFYEDLQLPMYAGICDIWLLYYGIKRRILKQDYGVEWLSYEDLNM